MIKGVLFDMDGVVLDSERIGTNVFIAEALKRGWKVEEAFFLKLLGTTRDAECALLKAEYGEDFPFDDIHNAYRAEMYRLATADGIPCKAGVRECFEGLKKRGLRIALATSSARSAVEAYIQHIPVMQNVFDFMVCGSEAGRSKPAPDIFLKAAEGLGLDIHECVGVEDSVAGLKSQTAAGCVRVLVPDVLPNDERYAGLWDYCLPTLHELCGLIDELNGENHA